MHVAGLPSYFDESSRKHPGIRALWEQEKCLARAQKLSQSAPRGVKIWGTQLFSCQEKERLVWTLSFSLRQVLMEKRQLAESFARSTVSCFSPLPASTPPPPPHTPPNLHHPGLFLFINQQPTCAHYLLQVSTDIQLVLLILTLTKGLCSCCSIEQLSGKSADRWLRAPRKNKCWDSLSTDHWSMCTFLRTSITLHEDMFCVAKAHRSCKTAHACMRHVHYPAELLYLQCTFEWYQDKIISQGLFFLFFLQLCTISCWYLAPSWYFQLMD